MLGGKSVISSKPLIYLSEDIKDLVQLTSAMFLQDNVPIGVPDIDHLEKDISMQASEVPATTAGGFEEKISRRVLGPSGAAEK
ncbi:hypothetical protein PR048_013247 [Dryococelus australis]|uniref:Uncharacterized protein n=1 Tax=Dryococelus australis TaxID=614101 RepID=A0ABQ9HS31_9NEOP|nr:hypothetical protein PR048_013247 [Dryococelus australis]